MAGWGRLLVRLSLPHATFVSAECLLCHPGRFPVAAEIEDIV